MSKDFLLPLISGASAGMGVDLILFPFDTLKTRLQSQKGFFKSGGFKGIYSGLSSTMIGSAPTAALFFTVYETSKRKLAKYSDNQLLTQIVAANLGEIAACSFRVPVDVVKQRAQSQPHLTTLSVFKSLIKSEGVRGFYRSYLTTVLREIPFGTIQYPLWEYLKTICAEYTRQKKCEPYQSAICGAIAGGFSAGVTTPLDVAKTRITLSEKKQKLTQKYKISNTLKEIVRENGYKGLFAGLVPRVTMISFGGLIFFGVYEKTKKLLCNLISLSEE